MSVRLEIPAAWQGRPVTLRIERAMWQTDVWVDGRRMNSSDSLVAEHRHELGPLSPGRHRLTIRVDNRMIHNLSTITHAYGPETQSRWNGLIGAITLEAANPVSIRSLAAFPAADRRSVRVVLQLANAESKPATTPAKLRLLAEHGEQAFAEATGEFRCPPGLEHQRSHAPARGSGAGLGRVSSRSLSHSHHAGRRARPAR